MKKIVLFFAATLFVMVSFAFAGVSFNASADPEPTPLPGLTAFDADKDAPVLLVAGEDTEVDKADDRVDDEDENEGEGEGLQGGGEKDD